MDNPKIFSVGTLTDQDLNALKALSKGEATEYEQKLSLAIIINKFARAQDLLYSPGSFDETAFINGRAFVGQSILRCINQPIGKLKEVNK